MKTHQEVSAGAISVAYTSFFTSKTCYLPTKLRDKSILYSVFCIKKEVALATSFFYCTFVSAPSVIVISTSNVSAPLVILTITFEFTLALIIGSMTL